MAKGRGRPKKKFKSRQVRIDNESADLLYFIAGTLGMDLPDYTNAQLVPVLRKIYADALEMQAKKNAKQMEGK